MIPDPPVFELWERPTLEANPYLRPYASITKTQLVGLLGALGEYAIRVGPVLGTVWHDPESAETNRALVAFYRRLKGGGGDIASTQFVFHAQERSRLSLHKYVRGCENLSKEEVLGLLEALGRYSLEAPRIKQVFGPFTFLVRAIHAHNALVSFRDRRFTLDEFSESVRTVLRGENSLLTTSTGGERELEIG